MIVCYSAWLFSMAYALHIVSLSFRYYAGTDEISSSREALYLVDKDNDVDLDNGDHDYLLMNEDTML